MEIEIIPLKLKITNCYLIKGSNGFVMVDAAPPRSAPLFQKALKDLSIDPGEIKMVFITHGHWDHWGSLKKIKDLTGAQAAINYREKSWVEKAEVLLPGGIGAWGKSIVVLMKFMMPIIRSQIESATVDIELQDDDFSLETFGIRGRLIHTPGHSDGSMSLLLDSGDAFVGDLAMSGFPRVGGPGPFVVGKDINTMKGSWQVLLDAGAVKIYPSHGKPFNAKVFDEYFKTSE
ncbi:MBL fold metallo-hydrolase [Bacteroidota bacterium]